MPTPRKSAAIHKLQGSYRRDRHGPVPPPEGEPLTLPKGLPADVRAAWADIVESAEGRLTAADSILVEAAARSLARVRSSDGKASDHANLTRALVALGLDALHRRPIEKPDPDNVFNEF